MTRSCALAAALFLVFGCGNSSSSDGAGGAPAGGTGGAAGVAAGGMAGGAAGGMAGNGATDGGTSAECGNILSGFEAALAEAKKCPLDADAAVCMGNVDTSIEGCGYYTRVEASNSKALSDLTMLKKQWDALACDSPQTCAVGGWGGSMTAKCEPSGQGGTTGGCL